MIYVLYSKSGVSSTGKQITYAYNGADQITRIRFAASRDIAYLYNSNGQVSEVRLIDHTTPGNAAGDVTRTLASDIRYLPFGPLTSLTYGNGLSLQRAFDADYRLSAQSVGSVQSLSYAYDLAGNVQGIDDLLHPAENQSFAADPLDRLLHASGSYGALDYSYDAVGNRLQAFRNANQTDYRYGLADQRLASLSGAVNQTFTYDATGNATHGDPYDFAYTPDQRMKQVSQGTSVLASYGTNGLGQRVEKTTPGGPLTFDYDLAGQLLRERESSRVYVPLNGERLGFVDGSDLYYTHNTHLGAPQAVTNQAQQVVWQANYEPFGQATLVNPSLTLNPRLPGQYFDQETGLHYNYFRDSYFPDLGRYGQSDPIGLAGGMNTYAYVGGNPVNWIDPLGLAIGDYPPVPPGYDPGTWKTGQWDNGKWVLTDPDGRSWTIHPEDDGHWRHWDKRGPGGKDDGSWPPNPDKPWPTQKKKLKPNQCPVDPSGDAPPWKPPFPSPDDTNPNDPTVPFVPLPEWTGGWVPIRAPIPVMP